MTGRAWWQTASAVLVGILLALTTRYIFVRIVGVLTLFAIGLLIAWVMDPLLDALQRKGWHRSVAVTAVTLGFVVCTAVVGILIVPGVVSQIQDAASHWRDYSATAQQSIQASRALVEHYAASKLPNVDVMPFLDQKVNESTEWLAAHIPAAVQWMSGRLIASIGLIAMGAILLLISFHFMMIIDPLRESIRKMLPERADCEMNRIGTQINAMLGQYLRGIVIVALCVAVSATVVLTIVHFIFGTKYALIIGVITGITYMIPYIGPLISALSAGFFGYVTADHAPWVACGVSIGCMYGVNQLFDAILTPRIVGQRIGLHPLVILFAVFIGVSLLGIPGMIIATPLAACLKIILARWLPIKEMDFTAPCPKRRLELDLPASVALLTKSITRLSHDLERTVGRHHDAPVPEQEQLPLETAPAAPAEETAVSEKDVDRDNA